MHVYAILMDYAISCLGDDLVLLTKTGPGTAGDTPEMLGVCFDADWIGPRANLCLR